MSTIKKFKKVRLFRLAKEFNVSVDALVEHMEESNHSEALTGRGINAAVSSEEAYDDLLNFFADDKVQADRVSKKRAALREEETGIEETDVAVDGEDQISPEPEPDTEAESLPVPEPESKPEIPMPF